MEPKEQPALPIRIPSFESEGFKSPPVSEFTESSCGEKIAKLIKAN